MGGGGGGSGYVNYTYARVWNNERGEFRSPAGGGAPRYPGGGVGFGGLPHLLEEMDLLQ